MSPHLDPDILVENHGSVMMIQPLTPAAENWIDENLNPEDWQWLGDAFACEPCCVSNILEGMEADGLIVHRRHFYGR